MSADVNKYAPTYQLSLIIRENRSKLSLSLEEMAEVVLCDEQTYVDLESGVNIPLAVYTEVIRIQEEFQSLTRSDFKRKVDRSLTTIRECSKSQNSPKKLT